MERQEILPSLKKRRNPRLNVSFTALVLALMTSCQGNTRRVISQEDAGNDASRDAAVTVVPFVEIPKEITTIRRTLDILEQSIKPDAGPKYKEALTALKIQLDKLQRRLDEEERQYNQLERSHKELENIRLQLYEVSQTEHKGDRLVDEAKNIPLDFLPIIELSEEIYILLVDYEEQPSSELLDEINALRNQYFELLERLKRRIHLFGEAGDFYSKAFDLLEILKAQSIANDDVKGEIDYEAIKHRVVDKIVAVTFSVHEQVEALMEADPDLAPIIGENSNLIFSR